MTQETHDDVESHDLDRQMILLVHASALPSKLHKTTFISNEKNISIHNIIIKSFLEITATKINASIIMEEERKLIKMLITCFAARVGLRHWEKRRQHKRKRVEAESLIADYFF